MRRLFLSVLIAAVRFFLVMNDRDSFEKITPQSAQKKTTSISALFFFIKRVRAEGHSLNSTFAVSREPGNNAAFCCSLVSLAHHALHLPLAVSKITHTVTLQMQFERASQTLVRTKAWHLQVPFILLCFSQRIITAGGTTAGCGSLALQVHSLQKVLGAFGEHSPYFLG